MTQKLLPLLHFSRNTQAAIPRVRVFPACNRFPVETSAWGLTPPARTSAKIKIKKEKKKEEATLEVRLDYLNKNCTVLALNPAEEIPGRKSDSKSLV